MLEVDGPAYLPALPATVVLWDEHYANVSSNFLPEVASPFSWPMALSTALARELPPFLANVAMFNHSENTASSFTGAVRLILEIANEPNVAGFFFLITRMQSNVHIRGKQHFPLYLFPPANFQHSRHYFTQMLLSSTTLLHWQGYDVTLVAEMHSIDNCALLTTPLPPCEHGTLLCFASTPQRNELMSNHTTNVAPSVRQLLLLNQTNVVAMPPTCYCHVNFYGTACDRFCDAASNCTAPYGRCNATDGSCICAKVCTTDNDNAMKNCWGGGGRQRRGGQGEGWVDGCEEPLPS